ASQPPHEAVQSCLESIQLLARLLNTAQVVLGLLSRYQLAALMRQELRDVAQRGVGGVTGRLGGPARSPHDEVRGTAPEHPGERVLQVRRQQQRELPVALRELRIAL